MLSGIDSSRIRQFASTESVGSFHISIEVSFLTKVSESKAPMSALILYVRMLGVCVVLACVMCCYVYRAGLDVGRGPMTALNTPHNSAL